MSCRLIVENAFRLPISTGADDDIGPFKYLLTTSEERGDQEACVRIVRVDIVSDLCLNFRGQNLHRKLKV